METIDRKTFDEGISRILQRLDRQDEVLSALQGMKTVEEQSPPVPVEDDMMDNQDLCMLLRVSKRSLQRYRSSGILPYRLIQRKPYYRKSDVEKFINDYTKEIHREQKGERKPRIYV